MGERNDLIENEDACYLLVKRGLYYRPDRQGYTGIKEKAGRYTRADGEQLSRSGVSFVHVDEAEEYSPSCNAETKADHLQAVLADRDATIATLSKALAEAEKKGAEDWQPIETAPKGKNGVAFMMLAFGPPGDQTVSEGLHFNGRFYAASVFYKVNPNDGRNYAFREHEVRPTHWRPTLAPPRDLSQGGQHG